MPNCNNETEEFNDAMNDGYFTCKQCGCHSVSKICEDCEAGGPFPIVSHGEQMNDYLSSGYAGADGCSPDF